MSKIIVPLSQRSPLVLIRFSNIEHGIASITSEKHPFVYGGKIFASNGLKFRIDKGLVNAYLPPSSIAGRWSLTVAGQMTEPLVFEVPDDGVHRLENLIV